MNRRQILKGLGAVGMAPAFSSLPAMAAPVSVATPSLAIRPETYKWAEMIVRAHNKCSTAMLERHLGLQATQATALQSQLLQNGVIQAQDSLGIHKATKPLWEGAFVKPAPQPRAAIDQLERLGNGADDTLPQDTTPEDLETETITSEARSDAETRFVSNTETELKSESPDEASGVTPMNDSKIQPDIMTQARS